MRPAEPLAYAQVAGRPPDHHAPSSTSPGAVRTGFLLLYPLSVLSATACSCAGELCTLAGAATALYGGRPARWSGTGVAPRRAGLADVVTLPDAACPHRVFVLGVACVTAALLELRPRGEPARAGRAASEAAAVEVADLRELNQVIVDSIQGGLMTTDSAGRILYLNAFWE
ncbi:MAG: hypothetical protein M0C28_27985, partial [Candidatus Moduliflexus flocculans]|nr:hypothetical protein [Candidatus Moduliflexus flocculans]